MKLMIVTALALTPLLAMDKESAKRLDESAAVFSEGWQRRIRAFRKICWKTPTAS